MLNQKQQSFNCINALQTFPKATKVIIPWSNKYILMWM